MEKEKLIVRSGNFYDEIEGKTPFAKAVNEKVREHWVISGQAMPIVTAAISTLADLYNELSAPRPEDGSNGKQE